MEALSTANEHYLVPSGSMTSNPDLRGRHWCACGEVLERIPDRDEALRRHVRALDLKRAAAEPSSGPPNSVPVARMGVQINMMVFDETTGVPHPCEIGMHAWAWLTAGGRACAVCGARR